MTSSQSFFKPQQEKPVINMTNRPSNIYIDGRADIAVAVFLIAYILTTTHQKKQQLADILLKPLLNKLQENTSLEKPSMGYLTPIKYLQQLCLETDPNSLVPALADVLNQLTLEHVLQNPCEFTRYFVDITPHTLSEENIENNPRCLNPLIPSVIARLLDLPFNISKTSDNKTLQKKHPHSNSTLEPNTGIKLHWQGGECLASANILGAPHFKNMDKTLFPPRAVLLAENIQQQIRYVSQETLRSAENYDDTKNKLNKYLTKEDVDARNIYFDYLNQPEHTEQPPAHLGTAHGTQDFYQPAVTGNSVTTHGHDLDERLEEALTRLLISGAKLNIRASHTEKPHRSDASYTAPAA